MKHVIGVVAYWTFIALWTFAIYVPLMTWLRSFEQKGRTR